VHQAADYGLGEESFLPLPGPWVAVVVPVGVGDVVGVGEVVGVPVGVAEVVGVADALGVAFGWT